MKISEAAKFESDLLTHPANHERNVRKIPRLCVAIISSLSLDGSSLNLVVSTAILRKRIVFTRNSALRFKPVFPFLKPKMYFNKIVTFPPNYYVSFFYTFISTNNLQA